MKTEKRKFKTDKFGMKWKRIKDCEIVELCNLIKTDPHSPRVSYLWDLYTADQLPF